MTHMHFGHAQYLPIALPLFALLACAKLEQVILYIECNPETVKSITSFPYIRKSF